MAAARPFGRRRQASAALDPAPPERPALLDQHKLGRLWPEPWASQVAVEAEFVRSHLNTALSAPTLPPGAAVARAQVADALEQVWRAIGAPGGEEGAGGRFDRWRGATVERAYGFLHAARTALVDVLPDEDVTAWFPGAVARVSQGVPAGNTSRTRLERLVADKTLTPAQRRAELKQALQLGYSASDRRYAQVRSFRNLLWKLVVAVGLFAVLFIATIAWQPDKLPLCFSPVAPATAAGAEAAPTFSVCPSRLTGGSPAVPSHWDVVVVALMGLIGGALAATFAIRKLRGTDIPYDVPLALAVLKVPLSGLTAVVGILLMTGGFVPGLSDLDSQGQVLAYAVVFGYAQQLLTQVVDNRAQSVLSSVPSTEPPAAPPS